MSNLVPINLTGSAMPVIDLGRGETISAPEFFGAIAQTAPLALQDQRWLYLVKMAFVENRADALMLAKTQAKQIQISQIVGNGQMGEIREIAQSYPQQAFPTTYQVPPPPPLIVVQPQIHFSPTISPTFTASPTQTASPSQTSSHQTRSGYWACDDWFFQGLGGFIVVVGILAFIAL